MQNKSVHTGRDIKAKQRFKAKKINAFFTSSGDTAIYKLRVYDIDKLLTLQNSIDHSVTEKSLNQKNTHKSIEHKPPWRQG